VRDWIRLSRYSCRSLKDAIQQNTPLNDQLILSVTVQSIRAKSLLCSI